MYINDYDKVFITIKLNLKSFRVLTIKNALKIQFKNALSTSEAPLKDLNHFFRTSKKSKTANLIRMNNMHKKVGRRLSSSR